MDVSRFSLKDKVALVIGGTSGIGKAIAAGMRDAGAALNVAGRDRAKLDAAVGDLSGGGTKVRGYQADVTDAAQLSGLVSGVIRDHGRIDILVNSQGTTIIKPALEFRPEEYDLLLATNLKSVYFACLEAGRHMLERRSGSIINIASVSSYRGWPGSSVYGITKFGVVSLTESLAAEWAQQGVRVNGIAPGFFMTELNQAKMQPERKAKALARTPMNRFGKVDELVGAAIYLASPAAGYVTGETIRVDGGYLASGI
jgi:NAD(P)-dependent dehydrogenase (short-subunit alcohol dehydrogenase family)